MPDAKQPDTKLDPKELLATAAATRECARLGVELSEASLKRAADRGELPAIRMVGRGMRLYKLADVRAFAKARRE